MPTAFHNDHGQPGHSHAENHQHGQEDLHSFDALLAKERITRWVVLLSSFTLVAELLVGWWSHSLALVADAWHMASHVGALGLAWIAYSACRHFARSKRFAFGQAKVLALAGYTNAIGLGAVGSVMLWEAWERSQSPQEIRFAQAIPVAAVGLLVNLVSAWLLHDSHGHKHDQNLRAAYLHVVADGFTSVLALAALIAGQVWHLLFLDPLCAAIGAAVVLVWATGLIKSAAMQLLDVQPLPNASVSP